MLATFYLTQRWRDNRLEGLDEMVQLGGESYKDIWQPDLFLKGRGMRVSATMMKNVMSEEQLTLINTTGLVTQTIGVRIRCSILVHTIHHYPLGTYKRGH